MDYINNFLLRLFNNPPTLFVQEGPVTGFDNISFFSGQSVDPGTMIGVLAGVAFLVIGLIYGTHKYNRWKKFQEFEDEMRMLDLSPEDQGPFVEMVRRFEMEEPVNILVSCRLFDEMATKEIQKVLGSAGSTQAKEHFIKMIYRIRTKTYHREWLQDDLEEGLEDQQKMAEQFAGATQ